MYPETILRPALAFRCEESSRNAPHPVDSLSTLKQRGLLTVKKRSHRYWKERSLQQHGLLFVVVVVVVAVSLVDEGVGSMAAAWVM